MNLRIVPALPSSPTVIFSLNWHNLPSSLPLPSFFSHQMATCQESGVPLPRNTLALDKAVGFHLLLEAVTFDLARGMVCVSWLDKRVQEWAIQDVQGLQASLEDVLDCVKQSGEEAEKEKKAAAEAKTSGTSQTSLPEVASTPISAHKRSRTASGIFSSLVASFIAPTAESPSAQLYRSRKSKSMSSIVPMYHKQNIFHPANKRDSFPTSTVPQSRFLRRQARAKLVDVFRFYVAGRLTTEMRSTGIVGEELRERGILDDLDADEEMEGGNLPGTSGYAAAGGYVAYMARSMLKTAFSQAKSEDDSMSSSSEDSMLMTPKNPSESSLPSDVDGKNPARPASPARRRATTPTPQARQIRHLSSVLIGLTQKDKRTTSDEREQLDLVEERSLRRRWSLCEASQAARARSVSRSRSSSIDWTKPVVPSPLRKVEVVEDVKDEEEIIVMRQSPVSEISIPFPSDSIVPDDEEGADITEQAMSTSSPSEEVPVSSASRTRRSSLLASTSGLSPIQTADVDSEMIASLPSPKYTEHDENAGSFARMQCQTFPEDVDVDSEEMDIPRISPPPQYAPSLSSEPSTTYIEMDVKREEPRGLGLDTKTPRTSQWARSEGGVYVS